jgi:hypothetical protein
MSTLIRKDLLPGLFITFSELDGTWLHFESTQHRGAINLEVMAEQGYGTVVNTAITEWLAAYRSTLP